MNIIDIAVAHLNEKGKDACTYKQISELSTGTLSSYVSKANPEHKDAQTKLASKFSSKEHKTSVKRSYGLNKAEDKLSGKAKIPANEEIIKETISPNTSSSDYIDDFVHSDDPRFKGDSKQKRIRRALGAYYGKKHSVKEQNAVEPLIGEDGKKKVKVKKRTEDGGRSQTGSVPNRFQNIGRDTAQSI